MIGYAVLVYSLNISADTDTQGTHTINTVNCQPREIPGNRSRDRVT